MLAADLDQQETVSVDMRLVNSVCTENHVLNTLFRNPEIKLDKKSAIVQDIFAEHVSQPTLAFLQFVVRKKRSVNLRGISAAYLDLYRQSRGIVLSKFTTATPADEVMLGQVEQVIARHTHKQVELVSQTDPSIIGGFSMEFDGNIYDARLSTLLVKLRQQFEDNIYESKL